MAEKKYYGVKVGRQTGVYETWAECKDQVHGFQGAVFKAFPTREAALAYVDCSNNTAPAEQDTADGYKVYVDGSFQKAKSIYSWAFVVYEGQELIHSASGVGDNPEAAAIHNVAGELAAAMRAIKWANEQGKKPLTIFHDYIGIAAWATGDWKAKNKFTQAYANFVSPYREWITFVKVKGHSGVAGNELADKLAGEAIKKIEQS